MKTIQLVGILLPIYQAAGHFGATPISYKNVTVHKVERAMMDKSPRITRRNEERLSPDTGPGGANIYTPVRHYIIELDLENNTLGELVHTALEAYGVERVEVIIDGSSIWFTHTDVQDWVEGIHGLQN